MLKECSPRSTVGDGNCMYRAVSLGLYGTEKHHTYLRILAALEMIEHPDEYDISSDNYTNTIPDSRILTPSYADLLNSVTSDGAYADLMHMFALSAAIGIPLSSFCPSVSFMTNMRHPYNMRIHGRNVRRTAEPKIHLLWTLTNKPTNLTTFVANHIVFLARTSPKSGVVDLTSNLVNKVVVEESYESQAVDCNKPEIPESIFHQNSVPNTDSGSEKRAADEQNEFCDQSNAHTELESDKEFQDDNEHAASDDHSIGLYSNFDSLPNGKFLKTEVAVSILLKRDTKAVHPTNNNNNNNNEYD